MAKTELDRWDPQVAQGVMHRIFSDRARASRACALFAECVREAHHAGPSAWSVTLKARMIRLNVGQIEVATLHEGTAKLVVAEPATLPVARGVKLDYSGRPAYPSVPVASGHAYLDLSRPVPPTLFEAHRRLVAEAARRKRLSPFRHAFSLGVLSYLDEAAEDARARLPRPEYFDEAEAHVVRSPDEALTTAFIEGGSRAILVNAYERDPEARRRCIDHYGFACSACDMRFGERYDDVVKELIHVHHLRPLSEIRAAYRVDPIADLRPICPNCHAVAHARKPPFTIEEVRGMLATRARGECD